MFAIKYFTTSSGKNPVSEFILKQEPKACYKILETISYLEQFGFQLPTDYLKKIRNNKKLWELRIKYRSKQYRIFLAKYKQEIILLLHIILKKKQKTPARAIKTAINRLKSL